MERYELPLTLDFGDSASSPASRDQAERRLIRAIGSTIPLAPSGDPYQDLLRARGELVGDGDARYAALTCTRVAGNRSGEVWRELRRAARALE